MRAGGAQERRLVHPDRRYRRRFRLVDRREYSDAQLRGRPTSQQRHLDRRLLHRLRDAPRSFNIKDYADFTDHEGSNLSYEDTCRGMSRGMNHSIEEGARDTGREQEAQVGRRKASATTWWTGLRRRERRFESCRGHHA